MLLNLNLVDFRIHADKVAYTASSWAITGEFGSAPVPSKVSRHAKEYTAANLSEVPQANAISARQNGRTQISLHGLHWGGTVAVIGSCQQWQLLGLIPGDD
jgi:hypothetical protein